MQMKKVWDNIQSPTLHLKISITISVWINSHIQSHSDNILWWAFIMEQTWDPDSFGLAGKCGVYERFCFINYQFFEIGTLSLSKYGCHELNK